jgi:endoglucanase
MRIANKLYLLGIMALGSTLSAQNYLHTSGSQIQDSQNNVVRLTGVSWFGFETSTFCPQGLWARSMDSMLDQMKSLGFNVIRVPYSTQMFDPGSTPNSFDSTLNPNLNGLSPIQILDLLVAGAKSRGIKIILDRHTLVADTQEPLWYTAQYPESRWISDWQMLATRYLGNDTVIGFDLHNEPHEPATWGDGNLSTDWRLAAERAGNAVLAVNPKLLVMVEGYDLNDYYWWGGDLSLAGQYPVQLNVANQLVYSVHDYPNSVSPSPWFNDPTYPANLPSVWNQYWGYLVKQNIAPVWIGEFGTADQTTSDQQWLSSIAAYIASNQLSFTFWCWNPNASDTGGILADDWQTVNQNKMTVLTPLLAPFIGSSLTPPPPSKPTAPTRVSAVAAAGQITVSWSAVSGVSGYNLYRGTTTGGEILYRSGLTATNFVDTGLPNSTSYYYEVTASNSAGEGVRSIEVKATTPTPAPVAPSSATVTTSGFVSSSTNAWWGEEDVTVSNQLPITAMTLVVSVANTGSVTFYDQYNTYDSSLFSMTYQNTGAAAIFTYTLNPGKTVPAGTSAFFGSQYNANGTARSVSGDTYTVTLTTGGVPQTLGGKFSGGAGTVKATVSTASATNPWWGEEDVYLSNTVPLTALTITVTVKNTGGVSFYDQYSAYWAGMLTSSYLATSAAVTYTYTLNSGWVVPAGTSWLVGSQYNAGGTTRLTSNDTYKITYTTGGTAKTLSGHF